MKYSITATHDTWLKKKPVQSSRLPDDQKVFCPENKHYVVDSYREDNNHIHITLAYGAGDWYIWSGHWDKDFGDDHIKSNHPAVQRQIDRLLKYTGIARLDTPVEYYSQRDNPHKNRKQAPWRTCNSSSNAMYLTWLQRATGQKAITNDNPYIDKVFTYGDTIYHGNQTKALKSYGFDTKWMTDADLPFLRALLKAGFPVVCNILHKGSVNRPSGGHVIILIGTEADRYIAQDPWGSLLSGYSNHNGAYSRIPFSNFKRRWQGGYRILA